MPARLLITLKLKKSNWENWQLWRACSFRSQLYFRFSESHLLLLWIKRTAKNYSILKLGTQFLHSWFFAVSGDGIILKRYIICCCCNFYSHTTRLAVQAPLFTESLVLYFQNLLNFCFVLLRRIRIRMLCLYNTKWKYWKVSKNN